MSRHRGTLQACVDCGASVRCFDRDELALCADCLQERADAQARQLVAEEPSTGSPEDILVANIDRERQLGAVAETFLGTLTAREREVLATDPDTASQATPEQIRDAQRRALFRLSRRAKSRTPEEP